MDAKLMVIAIFVLAMMMADPINADFFYNRPSPFVENLDGLGLKCVPGRTVIKVTEKEIEIVPEENSSDESVLRLGTRRKHMNVPTKDESCTICTCSVEGKDEYCSKRPAMNVNECLMMKEVMDRYNKSLPFELEKNLAYRIRRDYIWNNDEIPYAGNAACQRGHSYYSNSIKANDTDIDVGSDINSLLDYENPGVCFYCVCSVQGNNAGCISRNPWFCEYFRFIRTQDAARDLYRTKFEQDRPSYFRLLSQRLRRTMDKGIYDLIDSVDSGPGQKKCVPFVSQYTDCTDETICSGCSKCSCTADGYWQCDQIHECDEEDHNVQEYDINDEMIDNAVNNIENELKNKRIREAQASRYPQVPQPMKKFDKDVLLGQFKIYDPMKELMDSIRQKRSVTTESKAAMTNDTVKFFGVIDELNEDTLKHTNITGTLQAHKVDGVSLPNLSRRAGALDNTNTSLQIEFSEPHLYNHITDNKIDMTGRNDVTFDGSHDKADLIGNKTQETKDKELSKLVVNELKKSSEVIGDAAAPVISNITFTPENDTFTTMAFIAGNLLNKLWNIEKDAGGTSIATEVIKHENIANLLELFTEPLTLKQEKFLKTALAQLSSAFDKTKDTQNISICDNIEEAKKLLDDSSRSGEDNITDERKGCKKAQKEDSKLTKEAITKVNNVMALIQKFDSIQKKISSIEKYSDSDLNNKDRVLSSTLKKYSTDSAFTNDDKKSLNQFQNLLGKITGILYPKKSPNKMKNLNVYGSRENIKDKLKSMYDIDLNNMTVTSKDKLIFDYLSHIEANPECLLKASNRKTKTKSNLANVEGNILLNLSEFFKIKSFSDLVKLLEPKKEETTRKAIKTTEKPTESTTLNVEISKNINHKESSKLETTKDKLKAHLKTILEDLVEIQNARGVNTKNINLVDALPCIYNILNADQEITPTKTKNIDSSDKVASIFNELKNDLKSTHTRRSGIITGPRPKSAVVWERTIKALNENHKQKTRRTLDEKIPKSYEEIKKITEKIESSGSNTYKNIALLAEVPVADKLVLLKTLQADVKAYVNALEVIKLSIHNLNKLPSDKQLELIEFMSNAATHINLNDKVVNNINKSKGRRYFFDEMNSNRDTIKPKNKMKQTVSNDDITVSRDIIINQLIKNRVQLYMKLKEAKGLDLVSDMNYSIAQKISIFLDSGNVQLARELYKVFITQNMKQSDLDRGSINRHSVSPLQKRKDKMAPMSLQQKRPIIQFQEQKMPANPQWLNQDNLIKQLLNIKSMSG